MAHLGHGGAQSCSDRHRDGLCCDGAQRLRVALVLLSQNVQHLGAAASLLQRRWRWVRLQYDIATSHQLHDLLQQLRVLAQE